MCFLGVTKRKEKQKVTRQKESRYRLQGYDTRTGGEVDPKKIKKIQKEKSGKGKMGSDLGAQARKHDLHYREMKAKTMELEYKQRCGELVSVADIERENFRIGRRIHNAIMNIRSRIAGIVASETDQRKIHKILTDEFRTALEELQNLQGVSNAFADGENK